MTFTVGTAFSGIGVPDLAAELLGCKTLWHIEIDEFCRRVLAHHFPDAVQYGDIHEVSGLPHVDIFIAGFPCQPFSVSGNQKGSDDERYLVPEMMRIINEVRPRVFILENVPGFATLNDGVEFRRLLRAIAEIGYDAEWMHLSARDFGGMHERERIWIVGHARRDRHVQPRAIPDTAYHAQWHAAPYQQSRFAKPAASQPAGQVLVNASGKRRQKQHPATRRRHLGQSARRSTAQRAHRLHESRLGRNADVTPRQLDFRPAPAGQGAYQHPHEPPRVTAQDTPDRANRVKALGNSMHFDTCCSVLAAVLQWMQAQEHEQAA